jgi:SAM-dependent methyltransferase
VNYARARRLLPGPLRRSILHFEAAIEDALGAFAARLAPGARVLDAGAGEGQYRRFFARQHYVGADLGVGDAGWNYAGLDVLANLAELPFAPGCFDAAINIVTLEHLREPAAALAEISRTLKDGGLLLLVAPQEWEVHQAPHDYFRYTRHGLDYLLRQAAFEPLSIEPVGGYFRLLSRRLWNGLQFFPGLLFPLGLLLLAPAALVAPLLEPLDRRRDFTLGYTCTAQKSSSRRS